MSFWNIIYYLYFCLFHFLEASLIFLCQLLISCPLLTHVEVINFDVYLFFLLIFVLYWNTWKNLMKLQHLKTKTKKKLLYNLWSEVLVAKPRLTLASPWTGEWLLCPWHSPGKNTEWAAISFSRGSSQPRDRTQIFCFTGPSALQSEPPGKRHNLHTTLN